MCAEEPHTLPIFDYCTLPDGRPCLFHVIVDVIDRLTDRGDLLGILV
jgi:hypothetical protein